MSSEPESSKRPPRRTTFVIPNLRSPACASSVEDLLFRLRPRPLAIETSIASHSVIVEHDVSPCSTAIATALREAGYEADTIVTDPVVTSEWSDSTRHAADDDNPFEWFSRVACWIGRAFATTAQETKRSRGQQRVHEGEQHSLSSSSTGPSGEQGARPLVVVDTGSPKRLRATVSITGMTCGSCVARITSALNKKPWVKWPKVVLLTQSAVIDYDGEHNTEDLINIINGIGSYRATLEQVEELRPQSDSTGADLWRVTYSITGMSSDAHVQAITETLRALSCTQEVEVTLIPSSATILLKNRSYLPEVARAVKDVGYEAVLNAIVDVGEKTKDPRRTVSIRVDGMHDQHSFGKVADAIRQLDGSVTVSEPASFEDPITVLYTPQAPEFTIRTIMSAIESADPSFHPVLYQKPTLEERARQSRARSQRRILRRVILAIAVAIPSFILGIVYMNLVSESDPGRRYLMQELKGVTRAEWALFVMATPVYFFAASIFHHNTIRELRSLWRSDSTEPLLRRFYRFGNMDMLVSMGTSIAYFASVTRLIIATVVDHAEDICVTETYFDSVVFLTMFILLGRWIETYSNAKTGEAVSKLGNLRPKEALLVLRGSEDTEGFRRTQNVQVDFLEHNDVVKVVRGDSPPWDGFLIEGKGEFSESSLTGESRPAKKETGDPIFAGTINQEGPIQMLIAGSPGESMLDHIIKLVQEGQGCRAPFETIIDKAISKFVPSIFLIAIITWLVWLGLGLSGRLPDDYLDVKFGGWPFWSLRFAIAVFVTACPCGIGLAAPTALSIGGGLAAKYGFLAKGGGEAFQQASKLDIIVFDKTGTLTEGREPKLTDHVFLSPGESPWTEQLVLNYLVELESSSSHPIAKAVVAFCRRKGAAHAEAKAVEEIPGKGMKGVFAEKSLSDTVEILAGNEALLADHGIALGEEATATVDLWKSQAKSVVFVAGRLVIPDQDTPWETLAILATSDPIRPESRPVLEELRRRGIETWMLTGDNVKTACAVGTIVGIPTENIIAGVLPDQKAEKIKDLQAGEGKARSRGPFGLIRQRQSRPVVAMVGDGVNDSPALTVADVGIAIGSGSDIAISAAEFVLVKSDLTTLLTLMNLSRAVFRRVKFNFAWALVYNLVALPIAAGVLYPLKSHGSHVRMDPAWASLAMALSSISVICSSLLLRTKLPLVGFRNMDVIVKDV
ncbi:E1-E2 ATPase-domain-containing protein [Hypoxylon sp. FL1150]|nr:E1-E2 ATPase-domain-containing protein [Hypoxylon sp. FL1150]